MENCPFCSPKQPKQPKQSHAHTGEAGNGSLPAGYRIALAGNPNCGKTTLFNHYTKANQHVGNYPGVTVDRKEGCATTRDGRECSLVDLPGTYSLTAYTQEEIVTRKEMSIGKVAACINIVDASAIERNLLLSVQILEMGLPIVLACNMMDEARKAGFKIDMKELSKRLGFPVLPLVARKGEGADEILEAALEQAKGGRRDPLRLSYGRDIDEALLVLEEKVEQAGVLKEHYPAHWTALKLLEGDGEVRVALAKEHPEAAEEILKLCEQTEDHVRDALHASCESLITDARYGFIRGVLSNGVIVKDPEKDRLAMSDKIDKFLTNPVFGPIFMVGVLYCMFWLTFELGAYPQGWLEDLFSWLGSIIEGQMDEGLARSLIVDGIIGGVGGVVSFVPLIAIMFALIAFIEDSGYMARIAYIMDRIFRFFGLHGASVMPYIVAGGIAGGCAIPGVMATRTMRSPKEKLATLLTLPYMPCGAKVPVFLLLIAAFFPEKPALAFFVILLVGWLSALCVAWLFRHTFIRGSGTPFVMELPPYRMPTVFSMLIHCWERTWMYLKKAGTVILAISVLIWAGMTFPNLTPEQEAPFTQKISTLEEQLKTLDEKSEEYAATNDALSETQNELAEEKLRNSYAGRIGTAIEPVTQAAGFTWRTNIALLAGVAAKEAIVATLGTAYSLGGDVDEESDTLIEKIKEDKNFSKSVAAALIIFVLLYSPCFVALVVIRSEAGGWRWLFFSILFNTTLAFGLAAAVYKIGRLFL